MVIFHSKTNKRISVLIFCAIEASSGEYRLVENPDDVLIARNIYRDPLIVSSGKYNQLSQLSVLIIVTHYIYTDYLQLLPPKRFHSSTETPLSAVIVENPFLV